MVGFSRSTLSIVTVLNLLTETFAVPASAPEPIDYISLLETEPGLPTPKDLGLTNVNLTRPPPGMNLGLIDTRSTAYLRKFMNPQSDLTDANACWVYLNSLGNTRCVVSPGISYIRMCAIGNCGWPRWYGRAEIVRNGASSTCADVNMLLAVAGGFLATAEQGLGASGLVAGSNAAYRNGNRLVDVVGRGRYD
ncbi:hypothetical protein TWF173_001441 [Orbilia oligospora]|nr:hypothetical protein TWF173_001441 [Orbilia oligospora]